MKIQASQINRLFPELHDIPQKQKEEVVEIARYQSFKEHGGYKKLGWSYIGLGLLIFLIGVGAITLIPIFLMQNNGPSTVAMAGVVGGLASIIPMLLYQRSIIKNMRPKVHKLAKHYRSKEQ